MAIQPGSLSLEQRMKMLADEQATRSAKSKGLRTGASPPPQPSPTLQSTLNVRDRIGSAIDTGKWGYPPSPKGSVGPNSSIGTPVEKTVKLHETGAYNWPPAKPGEPDIRVVPGSPADVRARALGQQVSSGGAAPNPDMAVMMLARERTPFTGPTLAGKMASTQTSPIMPMPAAPAAPSAMGPNVDPREFDNRMAMLKREIIGNRAAAMGQPLDMDRWKLTPEQRAQQYATKANAALNISELNRAGQDMARARNPVAATLATPDQAAQSQQELLKASGQFGAFGPEPDLALRSQLLAKEMAPRRANAERMDAEAAARDSARAGDFREMEGRDRTQRANAEKLGEAELAARIGMLSGDVARNDPNLIRRGLEAGIGVQEAEAKARSAQAGSIGIGAQNAADEAMRQGKRASKTYAEESSGVRGAIEAAKGIVDSAQSRGSFFGMGRAGDVHNRVFGGDIAQEMQRIDAADVTVIGPLREYAAADPAGAARAAADILSTLPAVNESGAYGTPTFANNELRRYAQSLTRLRQSLQQIVDAAR